MAFEGLTTRFSTGSGSDRVLPEGAPHESTRSLPLPVLKTGSRPFVTLKGFVARCTKPLRSSQSLRFHALTISINGKL